PGSNAAAPQSARTRLRCFMVVPPSCSPSPEANDSHYDSRCQPRKWGPAGIAGAQVAAVSQAQVPLLQALSMSAPRLLCVVTEDWYFLSHRLPMARAAKAAGYEVHVATRF